MSLSFRFIVCISMLILALASCSPPASPFASAPPTSTANLRPTATPTEAVTGTAAFAVTPTPTEIATQEATSAPSTPIPEPSPRPTLTPTSPPTPTSPSPAPSPTPLSPPTSTPIPTAFDPSQVNLVLEEVTAALQAPVFLTHAGDGSGRLFILERAGTIRILADGALLSAPFLDIHDRVSSEGLEQGLLGLAFHPNYPANGRFFVYYTGLRGQTVLSRFQVTDDPNVADAVSEMVLLTVDQPARNHNGGMIAFGPDGFLYVGLGDGGAANDQFGNGQNLGSLLGALLRLEVDAGEPYGVPGDNPFLSVPNARPELWAYGLRNPWRFAFDRATGDLYIADVGQNQYEEVHVQPAGSPGGENYGWPIMEGRHCFQRDTCSTTGLQLPVTEYNHSQGCSITGGYVYRGGAFPSLNGLYFYGDYCSGRIWALSRDADGHWLSHQVLETSLNISSFGEDEAGEMYVLDLNGGAVYRLVDKEVP